MEGLTLGLQVKTMLRGAVTVKMPLARGGFVFRVKEAAGLTPVTLGLLLHRLSISYTYGNPVLTYFRQVQYDFDTCLSL